MANEQFGELSPDALTEILGRSGILPSGRVVAIATDANDAFNSAAQHLSVEYSAEAPADAPPRLFLKRNLHEPWAIHAGAREVAFYHAVAPSGLPMLVPCYAADYDAASGDSLILLRDVSGSHAAPVTRDQLIALDAVPPHGQLDAIVETVAGLHAWWWQHPLLGTEGAADAFAVNPWYRDQARFTSEQTVFATTWEIFRASTPELPDALKALYDDALARMPSLWDGLLARRISEGRALTLSHGDCYLSQFLCPRNGTSQPTYLIDFQGVCADLPTMDLVFLFATFWTPAQRKENDRERRLLRRYLDALVKAGVSGYSWDDLVTDYRLALIFMIYYPVWDMTNGSSRDYWWPKLRCLTSAYEDWECVDVLHGVAR